MTNVLVPCLTKLGQNFFSEETEPFIRWLDSLKENALTRILQWTFELFSIYLITF